MRTHVWIAGLSRGNLAAFLQQGNTERREISRERTKGNPKDNVIAFKHLEPISKTPLPMYFERFPSS